MRAKFAVVLISGKVIMLFNINAPSEIGLLRHFCFKLTSWLLNLSSLSIRQRGSKTPAGLFERSKKRRKSALHIGGHENFPWCWFGLYGGTLGCHSLQNGFAASGRSYFYVMVFCLAYRALENEHRKKSAGNKRNRGFYNFHFSWTKFFIANSLPTRPPGFNQKNWRNKEVRHTPLG